MPHDETGRDARRSIAMLIASMIIMGTIGIVRRSIPLSSEAIAFWRGVIGALALLPLACARRGGHGMTRRSLVVLIVSGALLGLDWAVLFEAYRYAPVPVVTLCCYMYPTFVVVLSALILHERVTRRGAACASVALIGVVMISGVLEEGGIRPEELKGVLFALCSACLYSTVVIMNESIHGVDVYAKTIVQLVASSAVLFPWLLLKDGIADGTWGPWTVVMLIISGVVNTGVAYALSFDAMEVLDAQTVAILSYIDPVTALVLSALILGERMTSLGVVGAALILGAAVVSRLRPREPRT